MKDEIIPVTKPYLPAIEKYFEYVKAIYTNGQLTNNGPLVRQLEKSLSDYLGVHHVICVANGTLALQVAFHALNLKGKVITTPFSFIASTSSLLWERLSPVFADINPNTWNLDVNEVSRTIAKHKNVEAIFPVHVFGNPCEVERINEVSKQYRIPVIYDASHAFGVEYKGESILNYGDVSTISFHATKVFHTVEGGAIITQNDEIAEKIRTLINFGMQNNSIINVGINAKMSEFHAAMGLAILDDIENVLNLRKVIWNRYENFYKNKITLQEMNSSLTKYNYSYFPVLFENESILLKYQKTAEAYGITPKRYFYPSLNTVFPDENRMEQASSESIASRILCLPISSSTVETYDRVLDVSLEL
jgi:dTDP-4-amino-4,6-dideoxygalactose transaminase